MSDVSYVAAMSHAPGIAAFTDAAPQEQRDGFLNAAAKVRADLAAIKPDLLVFVAPDHFTNFFVDRMPAFCVGLNDEYEGPVEKWLGLSKSKMRGAPAFATHLVEQLMEAGFDPAFSRGLELEHSVMVPMNLIRPERDIPIVWAMINCQVAPMPSLRRCFEFGRVLRQVIAARSEKVAVVATGGLSHSPGAAEADHLDPAFDEAFLAMLGGERPTDILDIPAERLDKAGFGSWEVRSWAVALGATGGRPARTLSYAPINAWQTGCAVSVFT